MKYRSACHAVGSMLRWREIRRGESSPFNGDGGGRSPGEDPDADALTVEILFQRHDRYRYLTRLLIERVSLESLPGREGKRARKAVRRFLWDLCHRGLLEYQGSDKYPHNQCFRNLHRKNCRYERLD